MIAGSEQARTESPAVSDSVKKPLRVALMINSYTQPRWVHKVISDIVSSPVAQLVLIIQNVSEEVEKQQIFSKLKGIFRQRQYLLYKIYSRLDARLFTE